MPDYSAILQAIESIQDANNKCYDDLKLIFSTGLNGIRAENNANQFVINESLKALDKTINAHNGRLFDVETKLEKREKISDDAIREFKGYVGKIKWIKKNWYLLIGLFIFAVGFVLILFRIEAVDKAISWLIGKI